MSTLTAPVDLAPVTLVFQREQDARDTAFRDLVRSLADGRARQPAADTIVKSLRASGRTPEDLEAALALYRRRVAARAALDAAGPVPAEREKINRLLDQASIACQQQIQQAQQKYAGTVAPLQARLQELEALEKAGRDAERLLFDTALPPSGEVVAALADLKQQLAAACQRRAVAAHAAGVAARAATSAAAQTRGSYTSGHHVTVAEEQTLLNRCAELGAEDDKQRALAAKEDVEIARLETEIAALDTRALLP
jgi:hypothetical protein